MADVTYDRLQKSGVDVNKNGNSEERGDNEDHQSNNDRNLANSTSSDQYEDASMELYNITQQILQFLD